MKTKIDDAGVKELKDGYVYDSAARRYCCLFCDAHYEDGNVYTCGKQMVTADKAVMLHIVEKHGTVFESLLSLDKSQTGLTETQKEFLLHSYKGVQDKEIAEKMEITASTVRFQRFNFREKAKQARLILALNDLFEEKEKTAKAAKNPTEEELMTEELFSSVSPLILKTFFFKKGRMKKQEFILKTIIKQFDKNVKYTEKEIKAKLKEIYSDYAALRRGFIDGGLMERTDDGREYWVK
jgi:hypothetical protein